MLDARHKAYLIRRDDTEHLVVIGPQGTATIETGHRQTGGRTPRTGGRIVTRSLALLFLRCLCGAVCLSRKSPCGRAGRRRAAAADGGLNINLTGGGMFTDRVMQIVALITILSIAPSILIMMTSFVRIVVVLSLLRTALGIQQSPPNSVIVSLALFLTFFVMTPTLTAAYNAGIEPLMKQQITTEQAIERAGTPVKKFMLAHVRDADLQAVRRHEPRQEAGQAGGCRPSRPWRRPSCCPSSSAPSRSAF